MTAALSVVVLAGVCWLGGQGGVVDGAKGV